jgi:hypothetical protein
VSTSRLYSTEPARRSRGPRAESAGRRPGRLPDTEAFQVYPTREGILRPTQCVLELDATSHERRAWSRYLRSSRDEAAKLAYQEDRCTGQLV